MAISYAFALATITQQMNQVQEAVNGAFKPLISNACELPQRLDAEEAFRRCTAIALKKSKIPRRKACLISKLFEMEESLLMSFRKGFYPTSKVLLRHAEMLKVI